MAESFDELPESAAALSQSNFTNILTTDEVATLLGDEKLLVELCARLAHSMEEPSAGGRLAIEPRQQVSGELYDRQQQRLFLPPYVEDVLNEATRRMMGGMGGWVDAIMRVQQKNDYTCIKDAVQNALIDVVLEHQHRDYHSAKAWRGDPVQNKGDDGQPATSSNGSSAAAATVGSVLSSKTEGAAATKRGKGAAVGGEDSGSDGDDDLAEDEDLRRERREADLTKDAEQKMDAEDGRDSADGGIESILHKPLAELRVRLEVVEKLVRQSRPDLATLWLRLTSAIEVSRQAMPAKQEASRHLLTLTTELASAEKLAEDANSAQTAKLLAAESDLDEKLTAHRLSVDSLESDVATSEEAARTAKAKTEMLRSVVKDNTGDSALRLIEEYVTQERDAEEKVELMRQAVATAAQPLAEMEAQLKAVRDKLGALKATDPIAARQAAAQLKIEMAAAAQEDRQLGELSTASCNAVLAARGELNRDVDSLQRYLRERELLRLVVHGSAYGSLKQHQLNSQSDRTPDAKSGGQLGINALPSVSASGAAQSVSAATSTGQVNTGGVGMPAASPYGSNRWNDCFNKARCGKPPEAADPQVKETSTTKAQTIPKSVKSLQQTGSESPADTRLLSVNSHQEAKVSPVTPITTAVLDDGATPTPANTSKRTVGTVEGVTARQLDERFFPGLPYATSSANVGGPAALARRRAEALTGVHKRPMAASEGTNHRIMPEVDGIIMALVLPAMAEKWQPADGDLVGCAPVVEKAPRQKGKKGKTGKKSSPKKRRLFYVGDKIYIIKLYLEYMRAEEITDYPFFVSNASLYANFQKFVAADNEHPLYAMRASLTHNFMYKLLVDADLFLLHTSASGGGGGPKQQRVKTSTLNARLAAKGPLAVKNSLPNTNTRLLSKQHEVLLQCCAEGSDVGERLDAAIKTEKVPWSISITEAIEQLKLRKAPAQTKDNDADSEDDQDDNDSGSGDGSRESSSASESEAATPSSAQSRKRHRGGESKSRRQPDDAGEEPRECSDDDGSKQSKKKKRCVVADEAVAVESSGAAMAAEPIVLVTPLALGSAARSHAVAAAGGGWVVLSNGKPELATVTCRRMADEVEYTEEYPCSCRGFVKTDEGDFSARVPYLLDLTPVAGSSMDTQLTFFRETLTTMLGRPAVVNYRIVRRLEKPAFPDGTCTSEMKLTKMEVVPINHVDALILMLEQPQHKCIGHMTVYGVYFVSALRGELARSACSDIVQCLSVMKGRAPRWTADKQGQHACDGCNKGGSDRVYRVGCLTKRVGSGNEVTRECINKESSRVPVKANCDAAIGETLLSRVHELADHMNCVTHQLARVAFNNMCTFAADTAQCRLGTHAADSAFSCVHISVNCGQHVHNCPTEAANSISARLFLSNEKRSVTGQELVLTDVMLAIRHATPGLRLPITNGSAWLTPQRAHPIAITAATGSQRDGNLAAQLNFHLGAFLTDTKHNA